METTASTATRAERADRPAFDRLSTVINLQNYTYGLVPIVVGLDKFMHLLTDWSKYLTPVIERVIPFQAHTFIKVEYLEVGISKGVLSSLPYLP